MYQDIVGPILVQVVVFYNSFLKSQKNTVLYLKVYFKKSYSHQI